jgi:hypothetical protein
LEINNQLRAIGSTSTLSGFRIVARGDTRYCNSVSNSLSCARLVDVLKTRPLQGVSERGSGALKVYLLAKCDFDAEIQSQNASQGAAGRIKCTGRETVAGVFAFPGALAALVDDSLAGWQSQIFAKLARQVVFR